MSRQVLLHYHLFKNAGSSIDRMLRESFGSAWINYDKDEPAARISAEEMQEYIEAHPEISAVSSHQVVPPMPIGDFEVFPIVFLRDPIDRVKSAWLFEWKKQLGLDEPKGSLSEYIIEKLEPPSGSVIANFHVSRLSNAMYNATPVKVACHENVRLNTAIAFLRSIKFFGIVERFNESIQLMATQTSELFPQLEYNVYQENTTQDPSLDAIDKFDQFKAEVGSELFDQVLLRNRLDIQLYNYAQGLFDARLEMAGLNPNPDESTGIAMQNIQRSVASM